MRMPRILIVVVLALLGILWIGQGTGLVGGSAMSGNSFWTGAGVVLLMTGGGLALFERRRARRS